MFGFPAAKANLHDWISITWYNMVLYKSVLIPYETTHLFIAIINLHIFFLYMPLIAFLEKVISARNES